MLQASGGVGGFQENVQQGMSPLIFNYFVHSAKCIEAPREVVIIIRMALPMAVGVDHSIQIIMLRFLAVALVRVSFHQRDVSHSKSVGRAVALEGEVIEDGGVVEVEEEVFMMMEEWEEEGTGLIHMNNNHQHILAKAVLPRQRILGALALSPKMGHGKPITKRRVIMAICRILGTAL